MFEVRIVYTVKIMSSEMVPIKKSATTKAPSARRVANQIPKELLDDPVLQIAINKLPSNYNFEIHKTLWRIKSHNMTKVALQFPEGLLIFANTIADIIENFTEAEVMILGDVTYGACCIDDFTARALGAQLLVHYGHSCLVPITTTDKIQVLYIFVDIKIDSLHFVETLVFNFKKGTRLALVSTVQFVRTLQAVYKDLEEHFKVFMPQCKPLSPGEILGCTSPKLKADVDAIIYLGDGRFHIESIMIQNPHLPAYGYNPFNKVFTRERFDTELLLTNRAREIDRAKDAHTFGVVMGTLGRQGGGPEGVENMRNKLKEHGKEVVLFLMSELFPDKLKLFESIEAWVQIACPRLSIDWGMFFKKPLLTPYEASVLMKEIDYQKTYPMDFYSHESLGNWTPNYKPKKSTKAECNGGCDNCA